MTIRKRDMATWCARALRQLLAVLVSLVLVSVPLRAVAEERSLVFAAMANFKPFTWAENGVPTGIDVDIIERLSQRLGVPIEIRLLPWKRVLLYTRNGSVDAGFPGFHVKEREQFAIYAQTPLHVSLYKVFVKKGRGFRFDSVDDLTGKMVGKNLGFRISDAFDAAAEQRLFQVMENDMATNLKLVAQGRLDAVVGNYAEVQLALRQQGLLDQVEALEKPIREPRAAYLLISKKASLNNLPRWVERIDQALLEMKRTGEIDQIYRKYSYDIGAISTPAAEQVPVIKQ